MRRLVFLFLAFFVFFTAKSQYPITQNLGSDSTLIRIGSNSKGAIRGGIINLTTSDTVSANLLRLKYYPGAMLYTTSDSLLWVRSPLGNKWMQVFTNNNGAGGDTLIWKMNGNEVGLRQATPVLGTLDGYDLNLVTDGSTRIVIPQSGILRSSSARNKYLTYDTLNKQLFYGDGGSNDYWSVNGNSGLTKNNFIGHIDSVPLVFKINGKRQLYISAPFDTTWYEGRGAVQDILIGDYAGGRHRDTVNGRIAIGDSALASFNLSSKWGPSPIAIGTGNLKRAVTSDGVTSVGKLTLSNHPNPYRISAFGDAAAIGALSGAYSAYFGTFAGEYATGFSGQTFIGVNNGRSGGGENDCFIGGATGYFSGGYVTGATVTNGGSGYTVATVTFSQAKLRSFGYDFRTTPTGTAVIEDGIITGIIMTQYGKGYNNTEPCIVTITGDGVGATAEAVIDFSGYNTFSGALAGYSNGWGKYNTHNGWSAGYNGQRDTGTTTIGAQANRLSSIPQSTVIKNATAIGYKSIFSQNNTIILGDTSIRTSIGIGTTQPTALLDIKSSLGYGFKLSDGREGTYKVLNSDANGNAFWANSPFTTNDAGKIRLPNGAKKNSDSSLIYISVPDANFTSASSYARTPKYTALRFATKDTGAVSVNHPYISFGRHLGQGIMLYDQISDSVACMGIGVAPYSLQSYIGNIGGHSFTWNWGGYREDLSNELMRLTNTGRLGIGTNTPTKVLDINSNSIRLRTAKTPSSATDIGEAGEIAWDENYIYVCVATNTWKRTALSTW